MNWDNVKFVAEHWLAVLAAVAVLTAVELLFRNKQLRAKTHSSLPAFVVFVRWLVAAVAFSVIFVAVRPLRDLESLSIQHSASSSTPTAAQQIESQNLKNDVDEIKWLLTLLVGFAVITSIAQAAAAWLSALSYDKQASSKLQEIEKLLESVKTRFPVFHEVEEKRNQAHDALIGTLRRVFDVPDSEQDPTDSISWVKDFYQLLDIEKRQLLLSVESFASVDLHPPLRGGEVQNLKLFAVFYHAKFRYEKKTDAPGLFADLERAEGYLLLALRKASGDFTLFNELGMLYICMAEHSKKPLPTDCPNYLEKARKAFNDSVDLRKNQQRAYYNLGYIAAVHDRNFRAAETLFVEAARYTNWQRNQNPFPSTLAAYVHYNLGCVTARVLTLNQETGVKITKDNARALIAAFDRAATLGKIDPDHVKNDFTSVDGDVQPLIREADDPLKKHLQTISEALVLGPPCPQATRQSVATATSALWESIKQSAREHLKPGGASNAP